MYILALDLSTKSTGYSIFNDKELIEYNCITAGSANLFSRIDKMIEELDKILQKYKFSHVYIEDVYPEDVHSNIQVYKALVYLQGYVLHKLDDYKLNHTFYTASEWRAKCGIHTGRGIRRDTLKASDVKFVQNQFGIKVNDDIADAIGIGFAAVGGEVKVPQVIKTSDGFEFG
jgi:Holliday junction resolvasome RuvABC endonuclease subunit